MTEKTQWEKLREPFPEEMIGKLPRVWCKSCSENKTQRHCPQHEIKKCNVCGNKITEAHLHLDYVGHAATTDRLLQVDPQWTWEPVAFTAEGAPLVTKDGLWIKLTICGVTRYGCGDGASVKECIGDAIRNAAMRFGVALDLWAKEDLHSQDSDDKPAAEQAAPAAPGEGGTDGNQPSAPGALPPVDVDPRVELLKLIESKGGDIKSAGEAYDQAVRQPRFADWLRAQRDWWEAQPVQSDFAKKATAAQKTRAAA